jgi:hypothetical protein
MSLKLPGLTHVMMCITSLRMIFKIRPNLLRVEIPANISGMSACLEPTAVSIVPVADPSFWTTTAGVTVLGTRERLGARTLLRELNFLENRLDSIWATAHEAAHIYHDAAFSKKRFWRLYRGIDGYTSLLTGSRPSDWDDRLFAGLDQIQLSSRQIELILSRVFSTLRDTELEGLTLISSLHATLAREILAAVRSVARGTLNSNEEATVSVRDRILSLAIRTGNSPPATAMKSLAGRKAESEILTLRVKNAAICEQKNGNHLSYAICQRRSATYFGRGTRNYAPPCRLSKSSGHRGNRSHHSVAQSGCAIWAAG